MSTLTLVRHGQATPFERITDRLSALGEQQARTLGEWWARRGVEFSEIYIGALERHRKTAELAGFSRYEVVAEWNEFAAEEILAAASRDGECARFAADFAETRDNRAFQRLVEAAVREWVRGSLEGVETWPEFRDRVRRAIRRILDGGGKGRRVAVFTSGGPIGVAVQTALKAPDEAAFDVACRIRNCSLTEFVFDSGRWSLDAFNSVAHLENPALRTFR